MRIWIVFAMLTLMSSTGFSQIDSVRSIIVAGDTLNCLSQEQTILLLEEFAYCESQRDSLQAIKIKLQACDSLVYTDSLLLENLERDLELADAEIEQYKIQVEALQELNAICEKEKKRLKRRQWLVGLTSGAGGVLVGILIGLFAN